MLFVSLLVGIVVAFALMFAVYKFIPGGLYINGALVVCGGAAGMWMTETLSAINIFYLVLFGAGICLIGYLKSSSSR